jgi:hypothetical protein
MRKYLLLLICISLFHSTFSQTVPDTLTTTITKEDLLTLSKKQRTTGIVLGTAGLVMISIGFTLSLDNMLESEEYREHTTAIDALSILGSVALAGGIYALIRSRVNNRKAMSMGFKLQPVLGDPISTLPNRNYPAAHLLIRF